MANNKENNINWYAALTIFVNNVKDKFKGYYSSADVDTKLTSKAETDFSNVKLSAADAGKLLRITAGGGLESYDPIKYEKGRVLSFAEQKTTGAFADRTLFSETLIKDGYAIVGGTDGSETVGEVISHRHKLLSTNNWGDYSYGMGYSYPSKGVSSVNTSGGSTAFYDKDHYGNIVVENTGGTANLPAGHKLIKYVYTALKDIKESEMGGDNDAGV